MKMENPLPTHFNQKIEARKPSLFGFIQGKIPLSCLAPHGTKEIGGRKSRADDLLFLDVYTRILDGFDHQFAIINRRKSLACI